MTRVSSLNIARAAAVGCLLATFPGCGDGAASAPPAAEPRVNAVMANTKKSSFDDLCDLAPDPAKPFTWPELAETAPPSAATFRWVNVWATWCKPCVEELPLLARTFADWKKQGQEVELTLVSVDADAQAAKDFIAERSGSPPTLQLKDATKAGAWLEQVGLASGASIPVHTVLDARGNLVCARAGGVSAAHLERFRHVMFP